MNYTRILGTGSYVPDKVLTNFDLEEKVNTSNEWIVERTGIRERHVLSENETSTDMMEMAAKRAIEKSGIDKNDIGLIIVATLSGEFITPSAACVLQNRLGVKNDCPAFDINVGCSGFIYGLNIVDQYIKNGIGKPVLLVGSEALSKVIDWKDRSTCVIFGDGAGAAILISDNQPGIYSIEIGSDSDFYPLLQIPSHLFPQNGGPYVKMRGNELFKIAVNKMSTIARDVLLKNDMDISQIDWLLPHQANLRIIKRVAKNINLSMEKVIVTIERYGNTSASSVPLALDTAIREGKMKKGQIVLMDVFGAGLTWGFEF